MNPYPGLRPFGEADRDFFFGREEEVDELLARLAARRLIAVLGVSGCGKSSLVHAGLIPILRSGLAAPLDGPWRICRLAPGGDPLGALSQAIAADLPRRSHALRDWAAAQPPGERILIFVDQFEEIFAYRKTTLERDGGNAAALFIDTLLTAAADPDVPLYIVLTMRTDYLGECAVFRGLSEALNDGSYLVPRLTRLRQQEAIERPAEALGVPLQSALVQRLLNDSEGDPDRLPVLQHLLRRLWEERRGGALDLPLYDAVGGWQHALEGDAEGVLAQFPHEQEAIARLFQWLADAGSGDKPVRRREPVADLPAITGLPPARLAEILDAFVRRDFLRVDSSLAGFMHESVMWQWPRLKNWIAQEAEEGARIRFLHEAARKRILLSGATLAEAQAFRERSASAPLWAARYLDTPEKVQLTRDWIAESARRQRDELAALRRSRRWLAVGLAAALLAVLLIAWLGWRARESQRAAEAQIARSDWSESRYAQEKNNPMGAVHFAAESIRLNPSFARSILLDIRSLWPQAALVGLFQQRGAVQGVQLSSDETRLLFWGDLGAQLWDLQSDRPILPPFPIQNSYGGATFDPSGNRILVWGHSDSVELFDARTGRALLPPLRHPESIFHAGFDPAGTRILSYCGDSAFLWDAASGRQLLRLQLPGTKVYGATFNRAGTRILAWGSDYELHRAEARVWDTAGGQALTPALSLPGGVTGALFSHNESLLLTWNSDGALRVWDDAGKPLTPVFQNGTSAQGAAFNPDDTRIVTWSWDNFARVWDSRTGSESLPPLRHEGIVDGAAYSPDGTRLLTWSRDTTARLWDAATGSPVIPPLQHDSWVTNAYFNHDGSRILTVSTEPSARLWDARTGALVLPPIWHQAALQGARFVHNESAILTWDLDGKTRLWDLAGRQPPDFAVHHQGKIFGADFDRDQTRFLTWSEDTTARLWDTRTGQSAGSPLQHPAPVWAGGFTSGGSRIVTTTAAGMLYLWDPRTLQPLIPPIRHQGAIAGVRFSRDQARVLTCSTDHTARLWDTRTGQPLAPPLEHGDTVFSAVFDPSETRIVTASGDGMARVWDARTGKPLLPPLQHDGSVTGAAFSHDGKRILTWSDDHTVRLWDASTGKPVFAPLRHGEEVTGAVFNGDDSRILSWSRDGTARVWEVRRGRQIGPPLTHQYRVSGAIYSQDESRILTWGDDNTARLWDARTHLPLIPALYHQNDVKGAAFNADETVIYTWSADGTARLWDTRTGLPLGPPLQHQKDINDLEVTSREDRIVTASDDATAHMWPMDIDLDFPPESVALWLEAVSGSGFDFVTRSVNALSPEAWRSARDRYEKVAAAHAKVCRYPEFNDWLLRHKSAGK